MQNMLRQTSEQKLSELRQTVSHSASATCRHSTSKHPGTAFDLHQITLPTAAVRIVKSWLSSASKDTAVKQHRCYYHSSHPQCTHKFSSITLQLTIRVTDQSVVRTLCPAESAAERKAMESSHCSGILVIHKLFDTWYFKSWESNCNIKAFFLYGECD